MLGTEAEVGYRRLVPTRASIASVSPLPAGTISVTSPQSSEPPAAPGRIGLVLGGGGAVGAAYHAGALTALEQDLGFDARTASVIVGTSAGSLVGTLLRIGVPASDLAALVVGAEALQASSAVVSSLMDRPAFPPLTLGTFLRVPRLPSLAMIIGLLRLTLRQRAIPVGALSMVLPEGREVLGSHLAFLDDREWPEDPLFVCAVRRRDWRRITFGSRRPSPRLSSAIAASCAVPGYFAGVDIDGEVYVDGGAISATNADVLVGHDIDLAVVISPMTGKVPRPSAAQAIRDLCRHTLDREVRALEKRGIPTVVIEPGADVVRHMSTDFMSEESSVAIMQEAFFDTGTQIAVNPWLRALSTRHNTTPSTDARDAESEAPVAASVPR